MTMHPPEISIYAGRALLSGKPAKICRLVRQSLRKRGITIVEETYVENIEPGKVTLTDGNSRPADIIFPAVGVRPSPLFAESGLPIGADGGLLVNKYLQSTGFENIFGGGDCIFFEPVPLAKVGVYAVRQNPILYHNLMACLQGNTLQPFEPGGKYLVILLIWELNSS